LISPNPPTSEQQQIERIAEEYRRLGRVRLAQECAKLQIPAEQAAAEEFFQGETKWPEDWDDGRAGE
jgi:hypothetical protein